ncbi:SCO family protein [Natronomonas sp.]|jgi:protein SCO1/2|uniref:SCO family protein n=1 Tax=Natronomonas sp. TaxID=2184060 RepID=UPI003989A3FB
MRRDSSPLPSIRDGRLARRRCLAALGAGTVAATGGCLGNAIGSSGNVVLDEQTDGYDSENLPYPSYGEPLPRVELPDALAGTTVATDSPDIEGRTLVVTACYAFCPAECLLLIDSLSKVQATLIEDGADGVEFLAITFDPERDTPSELEANAERHDVNLEASNWHCIRPTDAEAIEAIVADDLGVIYERDGGTGGLYEFIHQTVTFLVNPGRRVERVYHADAPEVARVSDDAAAVASAYT